MGVTLTTAVFIVLVVALGGLTIGVIGYGLMDALSTAKVVRIEICDPWTRMLDDALRRSPGQPRLGDAVRELKQHYAAVLRQRRELMIAIGTHERMPGQDSQHAFLEAQVVRRENELDLVRERIRELHALTVVRRVGETHDSLPIADGVLGRMRAEVEVERLASK